jgi:Fe-S cluster assembly protein SufD
MEAVARENDLLAASMADFEEKRFDGEPDWLSALRREAFARLNARGFPTTRDEAWRFTNVARIVRTPFQLASRRTGTPHPGSLPGGEGTRVVFVNGRYAPELSRPGGGPFVLRSLPEALLEDPRALQPHLGERAKFETSAFTALNSAFLEDGAFVRVPRGAVAQEPLHLVFLAGPDGDAPTVCHPRILIVAEANSQAKVVETYMGFRRLESGPHPGPLPEGEGGSTFTNSVTEIVCGEGAVLEHYKLQRESGSAFHVHTIACAQARRSRFDSHNFCLGSALARTDIEVLFEAEGSECSLNGLFVTSGTQHIDNHTLIDHAKPHCTSRELYKGILDGKSRGVFHGKIVVRPDAQKTDAVQTNKNLLLSRDALVDSTPALEILADDVKCRHGSTIGQLDANSLFYLRSRGISEEDARALLTYGFAADLTGRIRIPWVRAEIEAAVGLRLPGSETR